MEISKRLSDHIEASEQAVRWNKKKGNRHDELISDLYSKKAHFIYEIIQNTEDAYIRKKSNRGPCRLLFELFTDRLVIKHTGREFNEEDIISITTYANSTSQNELNRLGKFGIGFKSVYKITDKPIIKSGSYHFEIEHVEIPRIKEFRSGVEKFEETEIILPFKSQSEDLYNSINNSLNELNYEAILFLQKIESIEFIDHVAETHRTIKKSSKRPAGLKNVTECRVTCVENGIEDDEYSFLLRRQQSGLLSCAIAFCITKDDGIKFESIDNMAFVHFPTEQVTDLEFLIHGNFRTTPSRENISFEEHENKEIFDLLLDNFEEFIIELSTIKLGIDFLEVLPVREIGYRKSISNDFYCRLIDILKSNKVIPGVDGNKYLPEELLLPRNENLYKVLDKKDLEHIYEKKAFLPNGITESRHWSLHPFLTSTLKIEQIDFGDFILNPIVDGHFFESKSDAWMIRFYEALADGYFRRAYNQQNKIKLKPIIRIYTPDKSRKNVAVLDSNGVTQVFLRSESKKFHSVKPSLLKNKKVREFFIDDLDIGEPALIDEVFQGVLPKYQKGKSRVTIQNNIHHLKQIIKTLRDPAIDADKRSELRTLGQDTKLIRCKNGKDPDTIAYQ